MARLQWNTGRGRIEIAEAGVVDRFNRQIGLIVQRALKCQLAAIERDSRGEGDGQYAAVLAGKIVPLEAHLVCRGFYYARRALFRSQHKIGPAIRQGNEKPERGPKRGPSLNRPSSGLSL